MSELLYGRCLNCHNEWAEQAELFRCPQCASQKIEDVREAERRAEEEKVGTKTYLRRRESLIGPFVSTDEAIEWADEHGLGSLLRRKTDAVYGVRLDVTGSAATTRTPAEALESGAVADWRAERDSLGD